LQVTAVDLVDAGARHRWPDGAESVLRLVPGPLLPGGGDALVWFDPFDPADAAVTAYDGDTRPTSSAVVDWPPGPVRPRGARAGAAAVVGDAAAAVEWAPVAGTGGEQAGFGCSYGVGVVVVPESRERVVGAAARRDWLEPVVERVRAEHVSPLVVDGVVVGAAFDCGMGSSLNLLWAGLDAHRRTVSVVADLELLHGATGRV
jgi:hypothetical protein